MVYSSPLLLTILSAGVKRAWQRWHTALAKALDMLLGGKKERAGQGLRAALEGHAFWGEDSAVLTPGRPWHRRD